MTAARRNPLKQMAIFLALCTAIWLFVALPLFVQPPDPPFPRFDPPLWSCNSKGFNRHGSWNFIGIDLRFGRMTFGQAKGLDLAWNWIAGRGFQFVLALLAYRVFTDALMRTAEITYVPYELFTSLAIFSTKTDALWHLTRGVVSLRGWRVRFIIGWLLISTAYLSMFPSLMDLISGYEAAYNTVLILPNKTTLTLNNITSLEGYLYVKNCGPDDPDPASCQNYSFYDRVLNQSYADWSNYYYLSSPADDGTDSPSGADGASSGGSGDSTGAAGGSSSADSAGSADDAGSGNSNDGTEIVDGSVGPDSTDSADSADSAHSTDSTSSPSDAQAAGGIDFNAPPLLLRRTARTLQLRRRAKRLPMGLLARMGPRGRVPQQPLAPRALAPLARRRHAVAAVQTRPAHGHVPRHCRHRRSAPRGSRVRPVGVFRGRTGSRREPAGAAEVLCAARGGGEGAHWLVVESVGEVALELGSGLSVRGVMGMGMDGGMA